MRLPNERLRRPVVAFVALVVVTSAMAAGTAVAAPTASPSTLAVSSGDAVQPQPSAVADERGDVDSTATPSAAGDVESSAAASGAVDVVFVFDRSKSMNTERFQLAQEMRTFQRELLDSGVDARFGLVTYADGARVRQPLTTDYDQVAESMHFQTSGNVERASDAVNTAMEMDFREDATTVVVLVTDEDDDSDAAARRAALDELSDVEFVAVSPGDARTSGCDNHSPPCDNGSTNELRSYTARTGGTWVPIESDGEETMASVAKAVARNVDGVDVSTGDSSDSVNGVDVGPNVEATDRSANRTSVEVGDPVAFNVTVQNAGVVEGTYRAFLSTDGEILERKPVEVPRFSEETATIVHRFDEPGTYTVVLSHERVTNVEVREPDPRSVDVETNDHGTAVTASVSDARTERPVFVDLSSSSVLAPTGNELETVTVTPAAGAATPSHDVAFDLSVERHTSPPASIPELSADAGAVSYLSVTSSLSGDALSSVAFEYAAVSENVTMYRYDESEDAWAALDQQPLDGADGHLVATTDELSTFAIAVEDPAVAVESVSIGSTDVSEGDLVTATVTVSNQVGTEKPYEATVSMDGEVVASERVTVPAGETTEVMLAVPAESAGEYDLAVAGQDQGTLSVAAAESSTNEQTDADEDDDSMDADESSDETTAAATTTDDANTDGGAAGADGSTPGFTPAIAVLALLAAAFLATRRR